MRGYQDIYDYETIIVPKITKKAEELRKNPDLTPTERDTIVASWTKTWINQIRTHKKPERANVAVALFPKLPFKDGSFDQIVASWSISAHVFDLLSPDEFMTCWKELDRVLANDGNVYIFPLNYYFENYYDMLQSLQTMSKKLNLDYQLLDSDGEPINEDDFENSKYDVYTLHISKGQMSHE